MNPIRIWSRFVASLFFTAVLLLPLRFASGQQLPNTTRLLRFPTTNGDQIVFCYSGELYTVPRSWVEYTFKNLIYYNQVDRGGHFAAWEEPELFASEVRAAFRPFQTPT